MHMRVICECGMVGIKIEWNRPLKIFLSTFTITEIAAAFEALHNQYHMH